MRGKVLYTPPVSAGNSGRSYVVLGGRVSSCSLAPTLHVEGFHYREILGPSTTYAIAFTVAFHTCAVPVMGIVLRMRMACTVYGCHGNAEMHMHSECHLLALYSLQV